MKITFLGLSCFHIESATGHSILLDPYDDSQDYTLGVRFPTHLADGRPLGANLLLVSEPDADHAGVPRGLLEQAKATRPFEPVFPGLDLRGTLLYEWSGDACIGYHFTVDGYRCLHLSDMPHTLRAAQLQEIGTVDIVFMPAPKVPRDGIDPSVAKNLALLQPRYVVWAHHLAPPDLPETTDREEIVRYFQDYFALHAAGGKNYTGRDSFLALAYVWHNSLQAHACIGGEILQSPIVTLPTHTPKKLPLQSLLFRSMLGTPY
ncbi:MBL fold metallo-hydrolase [Candidatus Peribacteria bacterium]|nr:MBL fold metallo-hydrolase [Candidatus Peribacteria bacterium]